MRCNFFAAEVKRFGVIPAVGAVGIWFPIMIFDVSWHSFTTVGTVEAIGTGSQSVMDSVIGHMAVGVRPPLVTYY